MGSKPITKLPHAYYVVVLIFNTLHRKEHNAVTSTRVQRPDSSESGAVSFRAPHLPHEGNKNLFIVLPFFLGPLQITASLGLLSKNPTDITPRLSSTY